MTAEISARWYVVDRRGRALLCADEADAVELARTSNLQWPQHGPHVAVQLAPVDIQAAAPTDAEILAWAGEEQFFLFCDPDEVLDIVRSALQKFGKRP